MESETNQEESHFGRRNPTHSWNMWLSSKPNNHLEFQLDKTLKRTQHYGSEVLERVISEVFTKISYTGCNYPPVVSAGRPQLELCIWAEAALSESHRKILECHQSCDKLGIKRARAPKSSQGFYGSSQVVVEVEELLQSSAGAQKHTHKRPHTRKLCYLSLQVRGKQENHVLRKKSKEFGPKIYNRKRANTVISIYNNMTRCGPCSPKPSCRTNELTLETGMMKNGEKRSPVLLCNQLPHPLTFKCCPGWSPRPQEPDWVTPGISSAEDIRDPYCDHCWNDLQPLAKLPLLLNSK